MKKSVRLAATMLAAATLGACGTTNSTTATSQPFKAAWIYVGTAGDAPLLCGEGGSPFPLCADPKGTLSAIAQRLLK